MNADERFLHWFIKKTYNQHKIPSHQIDFDKTEYPAFNAWTNEGCPTCGPETTMVVKGTLVTTSGERKRCEIKLDQYGYNIQDILREMEEIF